MKRIITFFVAVLISVSVFAQTPEKMSYQAVIRNSSDILVTNTQIEMQISILQGSPNGTAVYVETQTPSSNTNGLVSLEIGSGSVISGDFTTIDWANGPFFIKTEIDPTGGTNYTITGTSQLLSVPYALHAKTAEGISGGITETDPVYSAWDKSTGISITESQISDLQNYLTSEVDGSVTNEIQALSISNDTIYLSNGGFVKLPAGFDGNFNSLTGVPANLDTDATDDFDGAYSSLSGAPTNVSSFANDAGYLTSFTEVDGSVTNEIQALSISNDTIYLSNGGFVKLPAGFDGNFNSLTGVPANLDTDVTDDFDGAYSSLSGAPTNVSSFANDAGYITSFTEVDGSVTNEIQALSISNDTIYLSNGGFVKLPADFDGNFSSLTGVPANLDTNATDDFDGAYSSLFGAPTNVSSFTNDAGYLTSFTEVDGSVTNEIELPTSGTVGDMVYWDGTAWVAIAATTNDSATLQMIGGVPTWTGGTPPAPTPTSVVNPTTGKTWMDRNLGASQVATSSTDAAAYGDLYQWGRAADGHESRTSGTTSTLATSDTPGHGDFITVFGTPADWRSPKNDNLWQGVNGTNNPCPSGYRLPTQSEWYSESASWSSDNTAGAFASPLKLPAAGARANSGALFLVGSRCQYWSSTVSGTGAYRLGVTSSSSTIVEDFRATGYSVRCIQD